MSGDMVARSSVTLEKDYDLQQETFLNAREFYVLKD